MKKMKCKRGLTVGNKEIVPYKYNNIDISNYYYVIKNINGLFLIEKSKYGSFGYLYANVLELEYTVVYEFKHRLIKCYTTNFIDIYDTAGNFILHHNTIKLYDNKLQLNNEIIKYALNQIRREKLMTLV